MFPRSTAPALGQEEMAPRATRPDVPGPGSLLSRAEGTEQDNVLNSHIKKKKISVSAGAPGDGHHRPPCLTRCQFSCSVSNAPCQL